MNERRALITGASEGIGRVFATKLAASGYSITAVARNAKRLDQLIGELAGAGHRAIAADLSIPAGIDALAAELVATHYDLLVNNAGFGIYGTFTTIPLAKQQEMTRLNIDAVVALSHAYLSTARRGDALINVSSGIGLMPMPAAGTYSATKAFVAAFSQSLWFEQRERGVYVMGLCPGVTSTRFNEVAGGTEQDRPPSGITQTPEQVVDTALRQLAKRRKPIVISGFANSLLSFFGRLLTRKSVAKMMGGMRKTT